MTKPQRKTAPAPMSEMPTQEQMAKFLYREEHLSAKPGSPKRLRNISGCEIDQMLYAGLISPEAHVSLNRFFNELREAGLIFSTRASLEPVSTTGSAQLIADKAFVRAVKVRDQMRALSSGLGSDGAQKILDLLQRDVRPKDRTLAASAAVILDQTRQSSQ